MPRRLPAQRDRDCRGVRLVSFPSWELFSAQSQEYRDAVLPPQVTARLAVEAGIAQGWERWVGDGGAIISIEHFGASAPAKVIFTQIGFTVENVIVRCRAIMNHQQSTKL